ncbi:DUF2973 domain-containing protein [Cyanobium sp. HWJ4-Hawea]|uniref:DUF2973 domain-containing protein n=1 Tax=unclassified Cyanobium TaxID=2627006 RepID=UPI0020CE73D1|nr:MULTISPECIES: DUF2973 domain-containing protein [unclassified Cyanobium]MCP9776192.1 DUF2973 domain-containing protein [Cyanobium sp. WAJ14-Wanaka]MCP9809766.1 DUF2973 domain-containing protein [Cyanobium sp. HWJ4-Hawea]
MNAFLSQILPLLYGLSFLILLWQAFKVMAQGFKAVPRPGDKVTGPTGLDRTGMVTIHPELLDAEGQITQEDLLTVRFSGDNEKWVLPKESPD